MEEGVRGGFCGASIRHMQANNKEMGDKYNPVQPVIDYFEANN